GPVAPDSRRPRTSSAAPSMPSSGTMPLSTAGCGKTSAGGSMAADLPPEAAPRGLMEAARWLDRHAPHLTTRWIEGEAGPCLNSLAALLDEIDTLRATTQRLEGERDQLTGELAAVNDFRSDQLAAIRNLLGAEDEDDEALLGSACAI